MRRDDLYTGQGVSGARASRPGFDKALKALREGDTLVITTLDRLGRSTANMLDLSKALRARGIGLRVLNLGGGDVDTGTPMGSMLFTVMAALAQMELEIKRERSTDSVSNRRAAGKDLGGRRERFTNSQIDNARRLIDAGQPATHVALGTWACPEQPCTGASQGLKPKTGSLPRDDICWAGIAIGVTGPKHS